MTPIVLFCKSYRTDLKRVVRLAVSVNKYNIEKLKFYVSVPSADFSIFQEHLNGFGVEILKDDEILSASPGINMTQLQQMPGSLNQQIVKSEFWRLGLSEAYLCLDSDAIFIRPFGLSDFMTSSGIPYTVIDEGHESLESAIRQNKWRVIKAYENESALFQRLFDRATRRYSFGPFPLIWHRDVWRSLEKNYFHPRGISMVEAISQAPVESRWYGEALLAYQAIPLLPCQPLFKVYHYAWQFDLDRRGGVTTEQLKHLYSGVIYQSAWERNMDWPIEGGGWPSKAGRRMRRILGRI